MADDMYGRDKDVDFRRDDSTEFERNQETGAGSATQLDSTTKNWAVGTHLSAFAGFFVPFGNIIAPLVIWLMKKDESPVIAEHAKETLNFQISTTIYFIVAGILCMVFIGVILLPIVFIVDLICIIIGTIKASEGTLYRYPFSIRLVN